MRYRLTVVRLEDRPDEEIERDRARSLRYPGEVIHLGPGMSPIDVMTERETRTLVVELSQEEYEAVKRAVLGSFA